MLRSLCRQFVAQPGLRARILSAGNGSQISARNQSSQPADYDDNLSFFQCVEKFFDRAADIVEPTLVEEMKGARGMSREDREKRVRGILSIIKPCTRVLSVTFPVKRDSGEFEMIEGWRAQHSDHYTPCKGGKYCYDMYDNE